MAVCLSVLGKISRRREFILLYTSFVHISEVGLNFMFQRSKKPVLATGEKTSGSWQCQFLSAALVTTGADVTQLFRRCPRHACPL